MILEEIKPQTPGQEKLMEALENEEYTVVGAFGPTGTGKSLLMISYAVEKVLEGRYKRLIISRPIVDVATGKELTASDLGDLYFEIQRTYVEDLFAGFGCYEEIKKLINERKIFFADTRYIRGRTFDDCILFLDEVQSMLPETVIELIVRLGKNSRLFVAGDPILQKTSEAAALIRGLLLEEKDAKVIDLGIKDIVRPGARRGLRLYFETILRKRQMNDFEKKIFEACKVHAPNAEVLTVVELRDLAEGFEVESERVPDAIIITKAGTLGRLIGKEGERIMKIEEDTETKLRGVELTLDFTKIIEAVHPVSRISRIIEDVDFAGPELRVLVKKRFGMFVGSRGKYVKFVDAVFRRMLGVGVRAIPPEEIE